MQQSIATSHCIKLQQRAPRVDCRGKLRNNAAATNYSSPIAAAQCLSHLLQHIATVYSCCRNLHQNIVLAICSGQLQQCVAATCSGAWQQEIEANFDFQVQQHMAETCFSKNLQWRQPIAPATCRNKSQHRTAAASKLQQSAAPASCNSSEL